MGLRLPPPTRFCLLRTCATPAWLRSPPCFRPLPDGLPLAFSPNYRTLSYSLLFCISLRFRLTLLSIVGPPLALPMVVGQPQALTLFLWPRLARTLLRWPARYSVGLRGPPAASHSSAGPRIPFAALEPCPVWVSAWASAGSSSELECSAVRLAAIPYRVSPGFSSIDAGLYVRPAALHRCSPPLLAVLPSEGGRCAVTAAPLPRRPRLCPSWRRLQAYSSVLLRSLFMFLLVNCFMRVPA